MQVLTATLLLTLVITLQYSCALSPTDCRAAEPVAGEALDVINEERQKGYLFQLLRVADAHLDRGQSAAVYYLVLDVKESDCSVLSRQHWEDCEPAVSRRPSELVIGQCKVIATTHLNESQDLRVNGFNCTTSSVSSALANTKDSPILFDFFEDTKLYRKQADKALEKYKRENDDFVSFRVDQVERVVRARGGERTNYYVDFSVRNCSSYHFPRHSNIFGFCRADLSYDVEASDWETPENIVINCEVFNLEEHRNISVVQPRSGHPLHSDAHEDSPAGKLPFKPSESRDHHRPHKPHTPGCPPPLEDQNHSDRPPLQAGALPLLPPSVSRCHHPHFGTNKTHGPPHKHGSSEHHPHGHRRHEHHPHGHYRRRHRPRGHRPHGHHPHGHYPHGRFHDHGPCDPPPHSQRPQDHYHPPSRQSEERGPGKGHFPFPWRQIGRVYRLPPLKKDEVLPLPEANFPSYSLPNHNNPSEPKIQPFPQSTSESCPWTFSSEFTHVSKFFAYTFPK
ncbi:histidine-rich glycoprotein [Manis javanica]|uniref:histidine-rich glycoprotein n=1 Tax=Manis javanica TaxID=9974 RepID=UPI003C6D4401|nr:Histidine-rich glycoprotein [Manis javanica]